MINIKDLRINLEQCLMSSHQMIIVPHNKVDFDAIGSAIALTLIGNKYKKDPYVIVNDPPHIMERGCKIIMDDAKNDIKFTNKEKYLKMHNDDNLFVLTDVNKKRLISMADIAKNPEKTVIIDHHLPDDDTLESNHIYIDSTVSSASEIIYKLLNEYKIKIPVNIANYLLAGIYLDTSKFVKNASPQTMEIVSKLMHCGANLDTVSSWFTEDIESYKKVHALVSAMDVIQYTYALIQASDDVEYEKEELAKAADEALKFGNDASFVIGRLSDEIIGISARSKSDLNVEPIMKEFGGGGNNHSGAAQIRNSTIPEIGEQLKKILKPKYYNK